MPDHWGFVGAAYGLAVIVLGGYWRFLARLERELTAPARGPRRPHGVRAAAADPQSSPATEAGRR
jgi:hypothetical protein